MIFRCVSGQWAWAPTEKTFIASYVASLQRSAKVGAPCLVNFITAVAYQFCLNLPATFTQPGASTLANLYRGGLKSALRVPWIWGGKLRFPACWRQKNAIFHLVLTEPGAPTLAPLCIQPESSSWPLPAKRPNTANYYILILWAAFSTKEEVVDLLRVHPQYREIPVVINLNGEESKPQPAA